MKRLLACILLTFLTCVQALASGESGARTVYMLVAASGGVRIQAPPGNGWNNPDNCTNSDSILIVPNQAEKDAMVSFALAAQMRGTQISASLSGCAAWGSITYPKVGGLRAL